MDTISCLDKNLFEASADLQHFLCTYCGKVVQDAYTDTRGHLFGGSCVKKLVIGLLRCPADGHYIEPQSFKKDPSATERLRGLKFKCPNYFQCRTASIMMQDLDRHLKNDCGVFPEPEATKSSKLVRPKEQSFDPLAIRSNRFEPNEGPCEESFGRGGGDFSGKPKTPTSSNNSETIDYNSNKLRTSVAIKNPEKVENSTICSQNPKSADPKEEVPVVKKLDQFADQIMGLLKESFSRFEERIVERLPSDAAITPQPKDHGLRNSNQANKENTATQKNRKRVLPKGKKRLVEKAPFYPKFAQEAGSAKNQFHQAKEKEASPTNPLSSMPSERYVRQKNFQPRLQKNIADNVPIPLPIGFRKNNENSLAGGENLISVLKQSQAQQIEPEAFDPASMGRSIHLVGKAQIKYAVSGEVVLLNQRVGSRRPIGLRLFIQAESNFAVGLCVKSTLEANKYRTRLGPSKATGCVLIDRTGQVENNGTRYKVQSSSPTVFDCTCVVSLEFCMDSKVLTIKNQTQKTFYQIKIPEDLDLKDLYPCFVLFAKGDFVRIEENIYTLNCLGFDQSVPRSTVSFAQGKASLISSNGNIALLKSRFDIDKVYKFKISSNSKSLISVGICNKSVAASSNFVADDSDLRGCYLFNSLGWQKRDDACPWLKGVHDFSFGDGDTLGLYYDSEDKKLCLKNSTSNKISKLFLKLNTAELKEYYPCVVLRAENDEVCLIES